MDTQTLPDYMLTPRMLENRKRAAERRERFILAAYVLAFLALILAAGALDHSYYQLTGVLP